MSNANSRTIWSFLLPYPARETPALHLWVFYAQLSRLGVARTRYIGSSDYFFSPSKLKDRWELMPGVSSSLGFSVPEDALVEAAEKAIVPPEVFEDLDAQTENRNRGYEFLLTRQYPPLVAWLERLFEETPIDDRPACILTFCNNPSISLVAKKYQCRVIHCELGPLRPPTYRSTAYFDFQGVNGNTEAERRYRELTVADLNFLESFSFTSIRQDFSRGRMFQPSQGFRSKVGLALQVEDDSNMLAFANGWSNFDLIIHARKVTHDWGDVLIRPHPKSRLYYPTSLGNLDDSTDSVEFLTKCERLLTVNSSTGFEALFWGVPAEFRGETSFGFLSRIALQSGGEGLEGNAFALAMKFYLLGYLVPKDLIFDRAYIEWRLSSPSEKDIFKRHLDYWDTEVKPSQLDTPNSRIASPLEAELRRFIDKTSFFASLSQEREIRLSECHARYKELFVLFDKASRELLPAINEIKERSPGIDVFAVSEAALKRIEGSLVALSSRVDTVSSSGSEVNLLTKKVLESVVNVLLLIESLIQENRKRASEAQALAGGLNRISQESAKLEDRTNDLLQKFSASKEQLQAIAGSIEQLPTRAEIKSIEGRITAAFGSAAETANSIREGLTTLEGLLRQNTNMAWAEIHRLNDLAKTHDEERLKLQSELSKVVEESSRLDRQLSKVNEESSRIARQLSDEKECLARLRSQFWSRIGRRLGFLK